MSAPARCVTAIGALVLPALARAAASLPAGDSGWSQRQLLLLGVLLVSVVLVAVAYVRIARKSVPPASPDPAARAAPLPAAAAPEATSLLADAGPTRKLTSRPATSRIPSTALPGAAPDLLLAEPSPSVELRASHGPLGGQVFSLPTPNGALAVAVGRDAASCQLVFPNELDTLGRLHAMLIWNPATRSLVVEDAGSGHGTFINARRLAPHEATALQDGDVIDLGGVAANRLSVRLRDAADPYTGALAQGSRLIVVQCAARGHLHFADADHSAACPICATMPHETLITRARPELRTDPEHTVARDPAAAALSPDAVVPALGWLSCIQGPDRGRDFRLVAGRNAIGRGEHMPVCLAGDDAVQRQQHAVVEFDAARQAFVLRSGDGRGLVYLNGVELAGPALLNPQDRIELGRSTLVFVPLAAAGPTADMDLAL